jgi:tungstate transport system substrate-binding protein
LQLIDYLATPLFFMKKLTLALWLLLTFPVQAVDILRMSTTTSTENSGLLAVLNPIFEQKYQARIDVIAVGTGNALKLGENGDVDIVFVHAPKIEIAFIEAGHGVNRQAVMHNDFVILGATTDKARLKSVKTVAAALQKIAYHQAPFISRGDNSGTHIKEQALWKLANQLPIGDWYISAGQGMGAVLKIADEQQAYTLTDRGTYIAYQDKIDLEIVFEGDPPLFNPYHIMAVNPARYPTVKSTLARKYITFITSAEGQSLIKHYKKHGQSLFYPDAIQP